MANAPVVFDIDWPACIRCGACVAVCPQPIRFTTPFDTIAEGVPCDIACLACEPICPTTAITHTLDRSSAAGSPDVKTVYMG